MNTRDEKPYLEKKSVILCRSGIMEYTRDEAIRMADLNKTRSMKDMYKVYRPRSVIIGSMEMMRELPIVVEHPSNDVDAVNWSNLAKGYTTSDLEVVPLESGEIGIKSHAIFPTHELYNYYLSGNEEVSLGYTAKYAAVENPDTVGYDIVMTEIVSVNHLALTSAGRGGNEVSVIDSIIGGMKQMKTGLFFSLFNKGKTRDGQKEKFSTAVFSAIERSKGLTGDALAKEIATVTDSIAILKDSPHKELLVGYVHDSFEVPEMAIQNKDALAKVLDSTYDAAEKETMDEDGRGTGTDNVQDGDPEKKPDKEPDGDEDDKMTKDSVVEMLEANNKKLRSEIEAIVKDALGIEETHAKPKGGAASTSDSLTDKIALDAVKIGDYI